MHFLKHFGLATVCASGLLVAGCNNNSSSPEPPETPVTAPTADFSATPMSGTLPLEVTFTDSSSDGTASITSWSWDFGDGTTSSEENPIHTFSTAGTFEVSLTVQSADGSDEEVKSDFITVEAAVAVREPSGVETVTIDGEDVEAAENEVLVYFVEDVTQEQIDGAIAAARAAGAFLVAFDAEFRVAQFLVPDGTAEVDIIAATEVEPGVSGSDLNRAIPLDFGHASNQKGYEDFLRSGPAPELRLEAVPAPSAVSFAGDYWIDQVRATPAWQALSGETLVANKIGIVDTGLPEDQAVIDGTRVERFSQSGDALTGDDSFADSTHGRDVAAFAGGFVDGPTPIRGINPHSEIVSVDAYRARFGLSAIFGFSTDLIDGARVAVDQGAEVINLSWGDTSSCSADQAARLASRQQFRRTLGTAIVNHARANDVNVVFSSGNNCEKQDDQLLPDVNDVAADSWLSHAMIVGASDEAENDACFSRMGEVVDIMAPGASVGFGDGSTTNGTSFSAPLVTGALGLIRSINETIAAPEAKNILTRTASARLTPQTTDENVADCEPFGRAVPEDTWAATTPTKILDLNAAVQTALLAKNVDLDALTPISLLKDETANVNIDIVLPEAGVTAIDLVFVIDQSGSYGDDINSLQAQADAIITDLEGRGIDIQYSVTGYSDFPLGGYGGSEDYAFNRFTSLTSDVDATLAAIDLLDQPLLYGADGPESQYEALYQVATGAGRDINGDGAFDGVGEFAPQPVGFRDGALPVVLIATDADFHNSDDEPDYPGAGRTEVLAALEEAGIVVFGLQSGGSSSAETRLTELATATNGAVFSLDFASSAIAAAISDALDDAVAESDVTLEVLAGANWVTDISPAVVEDVAPGGTASFNVTFTGQRNATIDDLSYDVYLWARANDTALVRRVVQPVTTGDGG